MKPINIFIDGICFTDVTLEPDRIEDILTVDIYKNGTRITSYSPDQHILHFMMDSKSAGKIYCLASKKVWEL